MSFAQGRVGIGATLLALAIANGPARAQYVPIRELDTNHLLTGPRLPYECVGGIAVGVWRQGPAGNMAVLWDATGSTLLPSLFAGGTCVAEGLASAMLMCGWSMDPATLNQVATRWQSGVAEDVNAFVTSGDPLYLVRANDVEERGRIVGEGFDTTTFAMHAFLFDGGAVTDLGSLNGASGSSRAERVNRRQQVAGTSVANSTWHACLFENGTVQDLHDPTVMTIDLSETFDISRNGEIVGSWGGQSVNAHAFLWDGTKVVDLTTVIPPGRSVANGMNDFGDIVGWYDPYCYGNPRLICPQAFLIRDGLFVDLNSLVDPALGWGLFNALDIDNEGRIVANGSIVGGESYAAFILEPDCFGTFTNYGTGCAGSGGVEPVLRGTGCPAPDRNFALEVVDGLANGVGLLFLGSGTTSVPVKPGCDLQILPLVLPVLPLVLDPWGESWNPQRLPAGTPIFDLNLQAFFFDPGAAHGISCTKPLALHFE